MDNLGWKWMKWMGIEVGNEQSNTETSDNSLFFDISLVSDRILWYWFCSKCRFVTSFLRDVISRGGVGFAWSRISQLPVATIGCTGKRQGTHI